MGRRNQLLSRQHLATLSKEQRAVLTEIFGPYAVLESAAEQYAQMSPSLEDIIEFSKLLVGETPERDFQAYFTAHPEFLTGVSGTAADSDIAFFVHPMIGREADFAIVSGGQGGISIEIIEIKKAHVKLFTRANTESQSLRTALSQGRDYLERVDLAKGAFFESVFKEIDRLPSWPLRSKKGSFRFFNDENTQSHRGRFDDGRSFTARFTTVIGRWSALDREHRSHLMRLTRGNMGPHRILTYEHFLRRAYSRVLHGNYNNTER